MPEHDDKLVSDTYAALNRDAPVSPPPALDAAILAEAHRAVQSAPGPVQRRSPTWFAPFAVAATVVLTTTLLVLAPRQQPGELIPSAEQVQSPEPVSRKQAATALDSVPEPEDGGRSAAQGLQDRARADALQGALADLPERQRQAVVLRHIEGFANPEIAAIMEISVEAVESLTARGKRALAALLAGRRAELGYEDDR